MRRTMLVASATLVLASSQDLGASQPQNPTAPLSVSAGHTMDSDEFNSTSLVAIPDDAPAGVVLGPLSITSAAGAIQDVSLELSISHPCTGDVVAWLYYDADDDGVYDAETPIEFYLARSELLLPAAWGCSIDLDGIYYFRHEEVAENLDGWDLGNFESFRGLQGGGSFYLRVVDTLEGEVGT